MANVTDQSIEMDQQLAKKLLIEGSCLIILGIPLGTEFGIDLKSWVTAERFKGIKMIPPGLHFVYYSATSKHGDVAPRTGFMHFFKQSEIVVKKWNPEKEYVSNEEVEVETVNRICADLKNLDPFLGVYPYDIYGKWRKLTAHISENLLSRLEPLSGQICSALELTSTTISPYRKRHNRLSSAAEELCATPGMELRLTPYPSESFPPGAGPQEITEHHLDKTYVLDSLIATYDRSSDLLGELQFSFVCFLLGHCLPALDQWRRLVRLLCGCQVAVCHRPQLYSQLLDVLDQQLAELPEDFFMDMNSDNLVYHSLRYLLHTMHTCDVNDRLRNKAEHIQQQVAIKFDWDFDHLDMEEGDNAPVIVDS